MKRRPLSLTLRLTLLFALVSTGVLLGLGGIIITAIEQHFIEQDREVLESRLNRVRDLLSHDPLRFQVPGFSEELQALLPGHHDLLLALYGPDGTLLWETGGLILPASVFQEARAQPDPRTLFVFSGTGVAVPQAGGHEQREQPGETIHYRGAMMPLLPPAEAAEGLWLGAAINIEHHRMFLSTFNHTLARFVAGAALLSGVLGWWAVRRGLRPLRQIEMQAASVTAQHLDQRLAVDAVPPELAGLAEALNRMLGRLEDAFQRLSNFSSDLAHELRTPISNLMTQTQVVLSQPRQQVVYQDVLASNAEELERLGRMIGDMLFLAKADHGLMPLLGELVRIEREVLDLFEFYDALVDERQVRLVLNGQGHCYGDRLMIRRALNNLLANAVQHTPAGGTVTVEVHPAEDDGLVLVISNPGPTISPQDLPHLFERFYRGDRARGHAETEGAGLGLAITHAIVTAHQGRIDVSSEAGMTRFTLYLPTGAVHHRLGGV